MCQMNIRFQATKLWCGIVTTVEIQIKQNRSDIHTDGGNGSDYLSKFQFVQDGCFSSSIKPDHKNPHLFFAKQALE